MADDKADKVTVGDKGGPGKVPLENTSVKVDIEKAPGASDEAVKKIRQQTKGDVRQAIRENADKGSDAQLDAVERKVSESADKINRGTVKKIKVTVEGEAGGEKIKRSTVSWIRAHHATGIKHILRGRSTCRDCCTCSCS